MGKVGQSLHDSALNVARSVLHRLAGEVDNRDLRWLLWGAEALEGERPLIEVGEHTYFKGWPRAHRYEPTDPPVTIGRYCSIANDVEFLLGGEHHFEFPTTFPLRHGENFFSRGPITVGNDVWIGRGAMIRSGVTIGDGAVVGARAMVTRDVRPYAMVVGVPAVEVRRRFSDDDVARLLEVQWWNWDDEKVRAFTDLLQAPDIGAFLAKAEAEA